MYSSESVEGQVFGCCEHCNGSSFSLIMWEFIDQLRDCQLLQNKYASCALVTQLLTLLSTFRLY